MSVQDAINFLTEIGVTVIHKPVALIYNGQYEEEVDVVEAAMKIKNRQRCFRAKDPFSNKI